MELLGVYVPCDNSKWAVAASMAQERMIIKDLNSWGWSRSHQKAHKQPRLAVVLV